MKEIIFAALALFAAIAYASTQEEGRLILSPTGVGSGSYGSATQAPSFTVDSTGRLTAAANHTIAIAGSQIASGTVAVAQGGTGLGVQTIGKMLQSNGTSWVAVGPCSAGQVLVSNGTIWACGAN
jgi:hypothetical protein